MCVRRQGWVGCVGGCFATFMDSKYQLLSLELTGGRRAAFAQLRQQGHQPCLDLAKDLVQPGSGHALFVVVQQHIIDRPVGEKARGRQERSAGSNAGSNGVSQVQVEGGMCVLCMHALWKGSFGQAWPRDPVSTAPSSAPDSMQPTQPCFILSPPSPASSSAHSLGAVHQGCLLPPQLHPLLQQRRKLLKVALPARLHPALQRTGGSEHGGEQ